MTLSWSNSSDAYRASRAKHPAQRIHLLYELLHRLLTNDLANSRVTETADLHSIWAESAPGTESSSSNSDRLANLPAGVLIFSQSLASR